MSTTVAREYPSFNAGMGTPRISAITLGQVTEPSDFDLDEFLTELAEIGVGTAILGLRRLNIERRKLIKDVPSLAPTVDAVLAQVDAFAQPVADVVGAVIAGLGDAIEGPRGEQIAKAGQTVADLGPTLIRLSGLTKRD